MGKYTVIQGQNIFDVALYLYGSIEGIVDLIMNNPSHSLASVLNRGDVLEFSDGFVINPDITTHFRLNNITPSNGERNVYFKKSVFPKVFKISLTGKKTSAAFSVSGCGTMEIDWGDNTSMETVMLSGDSKRIFHTFDNSVSRQRKIVIYGDFSVKQLDFSDLAAAKVLLLRPVLAEKFSFKDACTGIDFMALLKDVYEVNLRGLKTTTLLPLIENKNLFILDLRDSHFSEEVLDEYLITLVKKHYSRRSCTVYLSQTPSGIYGEPYRNQYGKYEVTSGMEAVWLLCNEPSWNEAGYWNFFINEEVYTSEKSNK